MPRLLPLCLLLVVPLPAFAEPFVEHLQPPAVQVGQTTRVLFVGHDLERTTGLWTSLPAGAVTAVVIGTPASDRVTLDVTVAASAVVGVHGLRLATADGLSNTHLVLLDDLPLAAWPEYVKELPAIVKPPVALWGTFTDSTIERIRIEAKAGDRLSIESVGNRLGKNVDPLLTIRDAGGRFVAERDQERGLYYDFRFEHEFAQAGMFTLELRDARNHGSPHGLFVLRLGKFPTARVAVPAAVRPGVASDIRLPELGGEPIRVSVPADQPEGPFNAVIKRPGDDGSSWLPLTARQADVYAEFEPNNTFKQATAVKLPAILGGVLGEPGDRDYWRFPLAVGQAISVRGEAKLLNSPAELELAVVNAQGQEVARASNIGEDEVLLQYTANQAGVYGLVVRELTHDGGPDFAYRLDVRVGPPPVRVQLDCEGLAVPRGNWQQLPLIIDRTHYHGPLKLSLVGAPAGLTLTPTEIPEKVTAFSVRLQAGEAMAEGLARVRVQVEPFAPPIPNAPTNAPKPVLPPSSWAWTRPLIEKQLKNVDLIIYALREEQRRLPAEVADRLAVQITPAVPFTLDGPATEQFINRYQTVGVPFVLKRAAGFALPVRFAATGGPLGPKAEFRSQLVLEPTTAGPAQGAVSAVFFTRNLIGNGTHRVDVRATAELPERTVTLIRSFPFTIRPAFAVEPMPTKLLEGETGTLTLKVTRHSGFTGPIQLQVENVGIFGLGERHTIPADKDTIVLPLTSQPERGPGNHGFRIFCRAPVGEFEENVLIGVNVEVSRKPVPPPKK